jgi:fatty-acyl-CoA synthase
MSEARLPGSPLYAALAGIAKAQPEAVAIRPPLDAADAEPWSYELFAQDARYIAAMLTAYEGLRAGETVAWLGVNHAHQLTSLFACALAGLTLVPLNWRLAAEELRWIESDCRFRLLLLGDEGDAGACGFTHPFVDEVAQRGQALQAESFAAALCGPSMWEHLQAAAADVGTSAPLLLVYTSGTTGRPKGAVLTQAAVLANARHAIDLFGITTHDRVLTVLPLFHVGGLCIQTLPALLAGAEVILHPRFDADAFFDSLERERPTLTLLVPAVMRALVEHPRWAGADLSCLRAVGAGSSEVPLSLIEAFHAKGVPVQQVYGATETGPIAIAQTRAEAWAAPGSIGRPVGAVECRLGEGDEILVRGPNVMRGYWGRDDGLDAAGWFATGDVGRVDDAGRWWFTDRRKHLIISGGENISPAEVERVLADAPGILEGAVCGRPDARWGEVPVAVVVPGPGFDAAAVLAHFEGRLARFKQPRAVVTVAALPRTALGKVAMAELRALALSRSGSAA